MSKKLQNLGRNPGNSPDSALIHLDIKTLREKITQLVEKNPQKAAIIVTEWISRPSNSQNYKKTG